MLLVLASCTDKSYSGSVSYMLSGYDPYPVLVSVGAVDQMETKGQGAVDSQGGWLAEDEDIYVYAFRYDSPTFAAKSFYDNTQCLVDASYPEAAYLNGGRHARVNKDNPFIIWNKDAEPLFYPTGADPYIFYAYYVDDCVVDDERIVRSDDAIVIPLEIDGTQDVMSAMSEIRDAQYQDKGFGTTEIQSLKNRSFSAYTANRNIHPAIYFHHHLVRLSFEAYPAREEAESVCIQDVSVSTRTKADFTVVHRDPSRIGMDFSGDDTLTEIHLPEADMSELKEDEYWLKWNPAFEHLDIYQRDCIRFGGSLLVAPAASYKSVITVKEVLAGRDYIKPLKMDILSPDGFKAGNHYVVRIAVYGSMAVQADVTLEAWTEGEDIIGDPDMEMEEK